jgi:hypothetical protein
MLFSQVAIPAPDNIVTLQWIIITVLASGLAYLFRQLRKEEKRKGEFLEKTLVVLGDTNEAIRGLADAFEAFQQHFSIMKEIDRLRDDIHDKKK